MFTQPPQTPVGGFVDGSGMVRGSRLRAAWLNYVSGQLPNALDAIAGGYYQFTGSIRLSSDTAQVKINAPGIGQPTKLLGFTTIGVSDDANYATGTGTLTVSVPATFSAGVTMTGALTFSNTVQFNGAVTVNAATTFTTNGDITLQSGCTLTGQSGSALTMDSGSTTTINGSATLAGNSTLSSLTSLTAASGATISLASNVMIATATRTYSRSKVFLQYVDVNYWRPNVLYVRSFPAVMSQLATAPAALQLDNAVWEVDIPDGGKIKTVSWTISPVIVARASLPTLPRFWVEVVDTSDGTISQSVEVVDPSATVGAYEDEHTITSATLNWTIDRTTEMVLIRVQGEGGATFNAGMLAYAPICNFERSKLAED